MTPISVWLAESPKVLKNQFRHASPNPPVFSVLLHVRRMRTRKCAGIATDFVTVVSKCWFSDEVILVSIS